MALSPQQASPEVYLDSDSDVELSDEQIHELLAQAEHRLQAKHSLSENAPFKLPKLDPGPISSEYKLETVGHVHKLNQKQSKATFDVAIKKIEDPVSKTQAKKEPKASTGEQWFNMPRTDLTPELRQELQLLKMRDVLDAKRHYKKSSMKDIPEFSHVGTIIEGPTEFLNGRLTNKERKRTFVEEVLAQEQETGRFKRKYSDIQKDKTSGKKAFYKALKAKRKGRVEKR